MTERKPSYTGGFFSFLPGVKKLAQSRAELENILGTVPFAHCAWNTDGALMHSPDIRPLLKLDSLKSYEDVLMAFCPDDTAALEGFLDRLQESGAEFTHIARLQDRSRIIRIWGRQHETGNMQNMVLWFEDITEHTSDFENMKSQKEEVETERDKLQIALDKMPLPLWMRDSHADLVWVNKTYADITGQSRATIIAEQIDLSIKTVKKGASDKVQLRNLTQKAFDESASDTLTGHLIVDGKRRLIKVQEILLPNLNIALGYGLDITGEEELETAHKHYIAANSELLQELGAAVGVFDVDQKLEFYNAAFASLWQLEDTYLNRKPPLSDIMESLRETRRLPEQADFRAFRKSWTNMFTSLIGPHEDMLYLPNGTALRMLVVPRTQGGLLMAFEDVTRRLELESSYNTLIAVQRETLDHLSEAVAVYGGDGRLKLSNPSFAMLWDLPPELLEGEPHITRLVDRMKLKIAQDDQAARQEELIAQGLDRKEREGRIQSSDDTLIEYRSVPLPDGGVLVTQSDITDSFNVENALREKNVALQAAERLKLDFLANISYQLRTPLNSLLGFSEILENEYFGALNEKQKEYTGGIHQAGQRLNTLINDILDLSSIEAGYMALDKDQFDIKDTMAVIQELMVDWARKKKINLEVSCADNIGTVEADEMRLKQVMMNLIRNSIAHTPEGGKIEVSAAKKGKNLLLKVTDTGIGIGEDDIRRVFKPFERQVGEGTDNKTTGGAGLGLTLVKNIIELHGGEVEIDSQVDKGTSITLILPLKAQYETGKEAAAAE